MPCPLTFYSPIAHTTENECSAYDLTVGYVGNEANGADKACADNIVLKPVTKVREGLECDPSLDLIYIN